MAIESDGRIEFDLLFGGRWAITANPANGQGVVALSEREHQWFIGLQWKITAVGGGCYR